MKLTAPMPTPVPTRLLAANAARRLTATAAVSRLVIGDRSGNLSP